MPGSPVKLIRPRRIADARGWFCETYSIASLAAHDVTELFVQDNQSQSNFAGTIRGIHFQRPPHAQGKLVRCTKGAIMDYAVDLRRGSPTYAQHVAAELTAENGDQLWIPPGFGHAFVTLVDETDVAYKVTDTYAADCDSGIRWNCPGVGIDWPLPKTGAVLSDKDRALPPLTQFDSPFDYDGVPIMPLEA